MKKLLYAHNESELLQRYDLITQEPYITKYPQVSSRLEHFWERRSEWALTYRLEKMMRGNHTNNYAEAGIRILKEIIFGRIKAYNLIQMFQFITVTMEKYFINRLLDMAHSRYRPGIALRYKALYSEQKTFTDIKQLRDSIYLIVENKPGVGILEFMVDMDIGICSCSLGTSGAPCKHQGAVARKFNICSVNLAPFYSQKTRQAFAILAVGESNIMDMDFYADLRTQDVTSLQKPDVQTPITISNETLTDELTPPLQDSDQEKLENHYTPPEDQLPTFRLALDEVVEDMLERVKEADHNYISGISKFIASYKAMQRSHAPTASIAYAFHSFGRPDRKLCLHRLNYLFQNTTLCVLGCPNHLHNAPIKSMPHQAYLGQML